MKKDNLSMYKCPLTGGELELLEEDTTENNLINNAVLFSKKANKKYFIKNGCIDFITPEQEITTAALRSFTVKLWSPQPAAVN